MLCQHLGVATEEGAYSQDKMSDPAYKPPPTISTSIKVSKGGAYMRDTMVIMVVLHERFATVIQKFCWRKKEKVMIQELLNCFLDSHLLKSTSVNCNPDLGSRV